MTVVYACVAFAVMAASAFFVVYACFQRPRGSDPPRAPSSEDTDDHSPREPLEYALVTNPSGEHALGATTKARDDPIADGDDPFGTKDDPNRACHAQHAHVAPRPAYMQRSGPIPTFFADPSPQPSCPR